MGDAADDAYDAALTVEDHDWDDPHDITDVEDGEELHERTGAGIWYDGRRFVPVDTLDQTHLENCLQFIARRGGLIGARLARLMQRKDEILGRRDAPEPPEERARLIQLVRIDAEIEALSRLAHGRGLSEYETISNGKRYLNLRDELRRRRRLQPKGQPRAKVPPCPQGPDFDDLII